MTRDLRKLAAARRAQMDGIFIPTPRTREAHEQFHFLMDHSAVSTSDKLCVLLVAPSQSGKSKVIETFADEMNTPEKLGQRQIPALHVTLHAEVTRKGLAQDILIALQRFGFETGPMKGSEPEMWERVYRYLRAGAVQLLVLDEVHHVKTTTSAMARSVGECIKHALLEGPCPIVLSGIYSAELPFRANEQLQLRAVPSIDLRKFRSDIPSDLDLFIEFLAAYLVRLEELGIARNATAVIEGDCPTCILGVSDGVLGAACRLLKEAVVCMTLDGRDDLRRSDLIKATNEAFIRPGLIDQNPFTSGVANIRREKMDV